MLLRRFTAFMLDYLVVSMIATAAIILLKVDDLMMVIYLLCSFFGYHITLYCFIGTTLGEKVVRLKTVNDDGMATEKLELSSYFFKTLGLVLLLAAPVLAFVVLLPKKRSFADRISSTKLENSEAKP
ncbi:RDD family protein [Vibrio sp. RW]|uniref:RDD family protein n=1 Tax=Vibrio sp. RW TaxID=2998833 RepID=UPI003FCC3466